MATNRHIQLIRSKMVVNSKPKLPQASDLKEGELALNYANGYETISMKNVSGEIVTFSSDAYYNKKEEVISGAINDLYATKADKTEIADIESGIEAVSGKISSIEAAVSGKADMSDVSVLSANVTTNTDNISTISGDLQTLSAMTIDDEEVIAAALNDLYGTKADKTELDDIEGDIEAVNDKISSIETKVTTNTDNISTISGDLQTLSASTAEDVVQTTYSDLVTLKNNGELIPGKSYRITDYVTTTVQVNTSAATNQFDVIVTATDVDKLDEDAKAVQHDGDTYFSEATLGAWELKYSLENDNTKFYWANTYSGKGVIYYMKDEWGNEAPYDFKNILFKRKYITEAKNPYSGNSTTDWGIVNKFCGYYQFGSGMLYPSNITASTEQWLFTFSELSSSGSDASVNDYSIAANGSGMKYCYENKIESIAQGSGQNRILLLNNIVIAVTDTTKLSYGNVFGANCRDITLYNGYGNKFGSANYSMVFGDNCYYNSFGNGCNNNSFGNDCFINSFGNNCDSNSFGNGCYNNSFGNDLQYNSFGNYNWHISFSNNCSFNSFGNGCNGNSFGNGYYKNSFGDWCSNNSFGNSCQMNSFGNSCGNNSFGNSCSSNSFGNRCESNSFGNSCNDNSFLNRFVYNTIGNDCNHIAIAKDYVRYIEIEDGNTNITLTSTQTTSSSNQLQNICISRGVNNSNDVKTISHNTVNDEFKTTYGNIMPNVTYSQLVGLKTANNLTPGQSYRITDYVTTTRQVNTSAATHQFDVIVTATDVDKLDENAKAAPHSGDTYFSGSTLNAWELKYSLENDTDKFAWAKSSGGKGVIYYMKDEFENEAPYDFKNIQYMFTQGFTVTFSTYGDTPRTKVYGRKSENDQVIDSVQYYGWTKIAEPSSGGVDLPNDYWTTTLTLSKSMDRYVISGGSAMTNSNGDIIEFHDEDFSTYTFDQQGSEASISGDTLRVNTNSIAPYIVDGKYTLNGIYFRSTSSNALGSHNNKFEGDCYNNSFGYGCYDNMFESGCYNNFFGYGCYSNLFSPKCYVNFFGNNCIQNSFENECNRNSFGNGCSRNSFGNSCSYNSFGSSCNNNSFGNYCGNNSFGNSCGYNSFGNSCYKNSFGNYCYYNSFGNDCDYCSFENNCYYNSFDNNCHAVNFQKDYMYNNIVEDGNQYINVTSTRTTSLSNVLRNITIAQGYNNTSTVKTISHNSVNDTFRTTYGNIMPNVTYDQLVALKNANNLTPGQSYRIMNYETTTSQYNTQSVYNKYDIIVTATDVDKLDENARAIQHPGDTYFANSDLSAWELKYCLENDTDKFAWADVNGTGVIYYMKDEFGNEAPYDFKNIQFRRHYVLSVSGNTPSDIVDKLCGYYDLTEKTTLPSDAEVYQKSLGMYTFSMLQSGVPLTEVADYSIQGNDGAIKYCYDNKISTHIQGDGSGRKMYLNNIVIASNEIVECYGNVFGTNCKNITMYNNSYGNKFGDDNYNIIFTNYCKYNSFGNACHDTILGDACQYNSFGDYCANNTFENSCQNNSFGNACHDNSFDYVCLNNSFGNNCGGNSFSGDCTDNIFGNSCYNNLLGFNCDGNLFGNECRQNSFGNGCMFNSFGSICNSNSFGEECFSNSFGNDCNSNSFGNGCNRNSFGNNCGNNSFNIECRRNSFGNGYNSNSFGDYCESNSFGNECDNNSFGDGCSINSFGNECVSNSFGNEFRYNSFGNVCHANSFGNKCNGNSFGNECVHINFQKDYMCNNIVEDGNQYIDVTSTQTTSSSNQLRNFTIAQGVNNTTTVKTISHDTVNDTFQTTYQAPSSTIVYV